MSSKPFVARWGIVATGRISSEFVADLVLDPTGRNVSDVAHAVTVVGSRNKQNAEELIKKIAPHGGWAQKSGLLNTVPEAVGSYAEVWNHKDVDIVYIGTPHTNHYEESLAALNAGKHVLCEKPVTLNAAEAQALIDLARSKKLLFVEGVWTRFFPLVYAFEDLVFEQKVIGDVRHVLVDFGIARLDYLPDTARLLAPELAGGALLDLGPYPLVWALLALYQNPDNAHTPPAVINGSMLKTPRTGVDVFTSWTLDFPKLGARANLTCNLSVLNAPEPVRIQGTNGEIVIRGAPARPTALIIRRKKEGSRDFEPDEIHEFPIQGVGLHWEADGVARSLRDGETESLRVPHEQSVLAMKIFDEVRRQGGYVYPEGLEKVKL
ncbi:NAD-binding protein [Ramaria rubella]|nr:NAD-binding protein [Ramaria rubella]